MQRNMKKRSKGWPCTALCSSANVRLNICPCKSKAAAKAVGAPSPNLWHIVPHVDLESNAPHDVDKSRSLQLAQCTFVALNFVTFGPFQNQMLPL